jgi:outer membrane protein OmpA-like peptidoglycan-associated protein
MRYQTMLLLCCLLLGSCTSPPKPPRVDESRRRPVNAAAAVELQACRGELQNTRIAANEAQRVAAAAIASAAQLARANGPVNRRNTVYAVLFPYGGTQVEMADADAGRLVEDARDAPLIVLRGRTDGLKATVGEASVARRRAEAVQALLVQAGIEPARIRTTWQPTSDHAADNTLPGGRALNRRVEIEIYRVAPRPPVALVATPSPAVDRHLPPQTTSEAHYGNQLH